MTAKAKLLKVLPLAAFSAGACALFFAAMPDVAVKAVRGSGAPAFAVFAPLSGGDASDISALELNDYAPIFIPTKWNSAPAPAALPKTRSWEAAAAQSALQSADLIDIKPETSAVKNLRADQLLVFMRSAFSGYGARERKIETFGRPHAFSITSLATGKEVFSGVLEGVEPDSFAGVAEFIVQVADGRVGAPVLRESSGSENADKALFGIIRAAFPPLPDGAFKVNVAP